MESKCFCGNIPWKTTEEEIKDLFSNYGTVSSVNIVKDKETGRSRGFAFISMGNRDEVAAAISNLNGKDVGGRAIMVSEAKPRQ